MFRGLGTELTTIAASIYDSIFSFCRFYWLHEWPFRFIEFDFYNWFEYCVRCRTETNPWGKSIFFFFLKPSFVRPNVTRTIKHVYTHNPWHFWFFNFVLFCCFCQRCYWCQLGSHEHGMRIVMKKKILIKLKTITKILEKKNKKSFYST